MSTGKPEKPRRGAWHEQARQMRADGLSYDEIGYRLGVTGVAAYFAVNPHKRWKGKKKPEPETATIAQPE